MASPAQAQNYPAKTVRILANGPGGGTDLAARLIAQGLAPPLGQPVIVENRGGAFVVAEAVMKAAPDGYTLYVTSGSLWLAPFIQNVSYDPVKDYAPISLVNKVANVLVVHPSLPVKTVKDLIALAKSRPGQLNYASAGTGGSPHLAAELFKAMAHVDIQRIPYKSAPPALSDLVGGQVQVMFATGGAVTSYLKAGRLKGLAVTSLQPTALFPGLPSISQSGLPGYESETLYGLFAPARTPAAIITRLSQETVRYVSDPETKERMLNAGMEPMGSTPDAFATIIKTEMTRMGKVIRDAGIREN